MSKKRIVEPKLSPFRLTIFSVVALFALVLGGLFVLPIYRKEYTKIEINNLTLLVEIASSPQARITGLSGRAGMAELEGMLFLFDREDYHAIWMKNMLFPLDILWIKHGRVVDMEEEAPAPVGGTSDALLPVYKPDVTAEFVLELKSGFAKKYDVRIGDEVKILFKDSGVKEVSAGGAPRDSSAITLQPGKELFIETLRQEPVRGSGFRIEKKLAENEVYEKLSIFYKSNDLTISGVMNVPISPPPPEGFPVLILNHGLIPPSIYFSGRGSKREQDFFARHGYVTIHSDYRGHASSSPINSAHHDFYVGYTEDVLALIDALKKVKPKLLDLDRIGMWGHSMGGGMATRVMVLNQDIRAYVLFAPISADAEDNFYELPADEISWLAQIYGIGAPAREIYNKISPLTYFADVSAPVQLHHGTEDKDVPIEFSEKIFESLQAHGKKAEFFKYYGERHEFGDAWSLAAERALQFFDKYVKLR